MNTEILKKNARLPVYASPVTDVFQDLELDIDSEDAEQVPHLYVWVPKTKELVRYPAAFGYESVFRPEMVYAWLEYISFTLENSGTEVLRTGSG